MTFLSKAFAHFHNTYSLLRSKLSEKVSLTPQHWKKRGLCDLLFLIAHAHVWQFAAGWSSARAVAQGPWVSLYRSLPMLIELITYIMIADSKSEGPGDRRWKLPLFKVWRRVTSAKFSWKMSYRPWVFIAPFMTCHYTDIWVIFKIFWLPIRF